MTRKRLKLLMYMRAERNHSRTMEFLFQEREDNVTDIANLESFLEMNGEDPSQNQEYMSLQLKLDETQKAITDACETLKIDTAAKIDDKCFRELDNSARGMRIIVAPKPPIQRERNPSTKRNIQVLTMGFEKDLDHAPIKSSVHGPPCIMSKMLVK